MYLQNLKYSVQRVFIFLSILILVVKNREVGWRGIAWCTKSIKRDESYLLTIPKKSAFSKSLIVMKCLKYLMCVFVKHWILNCQNKLDWKPGGKNYVATLSYLGNGKSVNLSFYLNHCYTHISKQILECIFPPNKYMKSWDAVLINQLTTAILQR